MSAVDLLASAAAWIAENETFLSGLAAIVAVAGVVLTPIGLALQRRHAENTAPEPAPGPAEAPTRSAAPGSHRPSIAVLPFTKVPPQRGPAKGDDWACGPLLGRAWGFQGERNLAHGFLGEWEPIPCLEPPP